MDMFESQIDFVFSVQFFVLLVVNLLYCVVLHFHVLALVMSAKAIYFSENLFSEKQNVNDMFLPPFCSLEIKRGIGISVKMLARNLSRVARNLSLPKTINVISTKQKIKPLEKTTFLRTLATGPGKYQINQVHQYL